MRSLICYENRCGLNLALFWSQVYDRSKWEKIHPFYLSCHQKECKSILNRDLRLHMMLFLRLGTPQQNQTSDNFSCICSSISMIFPGSKWALKAQSPMLWNQAKHLVFSILWWKKSRCPSAHLIYCQKKGLGAVLKNMPKCGFGLQETDIYLTQWSLFSEIYEEKAITFLKI